MIKFFIAGRRKRQDTRARYFYEWSIIHVSLMTQTPSLMRTFKRYGQHYAIDGITSDMLLYPLSPMEWDSLADHWVDSVEQLVEPFNSPDYVGRMQPHVFGDPAFALELTGMGRTVIEQPGFLPGRVKPTSFLKKRLGVSELTGRSPSRSARARRGSSRRRARSRWSRPSAQCSTTPIP